MPSLMKFLAITVAVLFTTTNAVNAWFLSDPNSIGSITVALDDDAQNACWTNLREAREYAEEKLNIERYDVLAEDGEYTFNIHVFAMRSRGGMCFGNVQVTIRVSSYRNGVFGWHQIGEKTGVYLRPDNFNTDVIEVISEMAAEM